MSLVEMSAVLAIAAIGAAVAAPKLANAGARYRADLAAQRIASDLMLGRSRAIGTSVTQTVKFTLASSSYTMTGVRDLRTTSTSYFVDLRQDPYRASLSSASFGGSNQVTFDMYGKASGTGTVVIIAGNYRRTVTLDGNSGKASWQ